MEVVYSQSLRGGRDVHTKGEDAWAPIANVGTVNASPGSEMVVYGQFSEGACAPSARRLGKPEATDEPQATDKPEPTDKPDPFSGVDLSVSDRSGPKTRYRFAVLYPQPMYEPHSGLPEDFNPDSLAPRFPAWRSLNSILLGEIAVHPKEQ